MATNDMPSNDPAPGSPAPGSHAPDGRSGGADGGARPVGFPGCRLCPYRRGDRPGVCLSCLEASTGQVGPLAPRQVGPLAPGQVGPPALRRCASCEQLLRGPGPCPTHWCGRADRGWSVVFAAGVHAGGLRRAVVRYKYGGERWWAGVFARMLAGYLDRRAPWFEDFDAIVPMPAYTGPGARRGWDPLAEVAAALGPLVGASWTIETDLVVKVAETPPMSGRSRADRVRIAARHLRAALDVPDPDRVNGARLLVVDDVLAEGSTLREVARALRRAGAAEVAGLVLARPDWRGAGVDGDRDAPGPVGDGGEAAPDRRRVEGDAPPVPGWRRGAPGDGPP